jgi:uncharacterized membrane protein
VAITSFPEQHRIAVKNQLTTEATIVARGYANQPVTLDLLVSDTEGNEKVVATEIVTPPSAFVEQKVKFKGYFPPEAGQFRMRVVARPQDNEVATRNNELPSFLNVWPGGLRVLYLEGNLSWEQSFLRQAIPTAAQGIDLTFRIVHPDERNRQSWPITGEISQLFTEETFDVYIIGDLDSRALHSNDPQNPTRNLELLAEAVDRGKGLIMLGGLHSFGPGGYHSTPLDDVLPIEMSLDERQDFPPALIRKDLHIDRDVKLIPTKDHYLTRITDSDDFRKAWEELPPLKGANRFSGVKENAEVLIKSDTGNPILVAGRIGGRVLAFAGDSTWRWPMHGKTEEFNRFWRQVILWLAFQDGKQIESVWIDLPQRRFQPRSLVRFTAHASDSTGGMIKDAQFTANLVAPNGAESPIQVDNTSRGQIDRESVAEPGLYKIQLSGSRNGHEIGQSVFEFVVVDRDKEKATPAADPEQLALFAAATQQNGGRVIQPEELSQLLDDLRNNPPETIEVPLKWRLGETAVDAAAFLLLFVGLLTAEWLLRKKWGLV